MSTSVSGAAQGWASLELLKDGGAKKSPSIKSDKHILE